MWWQRRMVAGIPMSRRAASACRYGLGEWASALATLKNTSRCTREPARAATVASTVPRLAAV